MLVPMKQIVDEAYAGGYGVPALPSMNEIQIRATIEAAVEANSPLIFLTSNRGNAEFNHGLVKYFADQVDIPIALCLDHSPSFEDCIVGIRTGCTAIMADRSQLPYEENVAQVKLLAEIAHAAGISIEAELGHVGQGDNYAVDGISALTDPKEAKSYIAETGVDCLAVAIGTAHGAYAGTPKLDFDRLQEINDACGIPLVIHGGSGSGDDNLHRVCTMGVAKVNIVTDVLAATYRAILAGDFSGNKGHGLYPTMFAANKNEALRSFDITGSTGKAKIKSSDLVGFDTASTQEK
ncbi:MAG: class II fructose-bisphosphate aldolase [Oscillospiraceae bacterium]|nr:class II fructose-bisphosphate aldolase [Oscillospiraceae bacterium]